MRARVPHHLIDILDPCEPYSAARFAEDARRLIEEIRGRGRVPLLVGGTMLYFRALTRGLSELPPADAGLRTRLEAEAATFGRSEAHTSELQSLLRISYAVFCLKKQNCGAPCSIMLIPSLPHQKQIHKHKERTK